MTETRRNPVGFEPHRSEEPMLREDTVQEVLARLARGESVKAIAHELGMDRKAVKRWRRLGQWQPRQRGPRPGSLSGPTGPAWPGSRVQCEGAAS